MPSSRKAGVAKLVSIIDNLSTKFTPEDLDPRRYIVQEVRILANALRLEGGKDIHTPADAVL